MRKKTLKRSMILWIWGVTAAIFLSILCIDFIYTKDRMEKVIKENAVNLARYYGKRMDAMFGEASVIPKMMAISLETEYAENETVDDKEEIWKSYVRKSVERNPFIFGAGIAFEPYAFSSEVEAFCPYYCFEEGKMVYYQLGEGDYNYFKRDWYTLPKKNRSPLWTEPYFDDVLMITYTYPFFHDKKFMGVAEVDISLDQLTQDINKLKVMDTGYAFMLSSKGTFLSYPDKDKILKKNIGEISPAIAEKVKLLPGLPSGEWIFFETKDPLKGEKSWVILRPGRHAGAMVGTIGFVYPEKEVLTDIIEMRRETILIGILALTLLLFIIIALSDSISRPITKLAEGVAMVAEGDLEHKISVTARTLEVMTLQSSFNKMSDDLKTYINNLKETTAAKERIESELKIANQIQASMLPRIFPPFPNRKEFDIFALMDPAKEVGGDFYDFFFINEDKLCFLIADVSGKGIPAALFMVITKVLLKNAALNGLSAEEILSRANNVLYPDNAESMFVTVLCAILNIRTGEIQFANAGHNPPLICRKGGDFEFLKLKNNFVLAAANTTKFLPDETRLNRGDIIFFYTDGVTEAMNPDSKQFSEARLKEQLTKIKTQSVTDMIHTIRGQIKDFAAGMEQSDDITMLALEFKGVV